MQSPRNHYNVVMIVRNLFLDVHRGGKIYMMENTGFLKC